MDSSRESLKKVIALIAEISKASKIKGSRNFLDFFVDRIKQASTEENILSFIEKLSTLVDSGINNLNPKVYREWLGSHGDNAPSVLKWIRDYPNVVGALVMTRRDERDEIIDSIEVQEAAQAGSAVKRRPFDINLTFTCTSPLSHGGDVKAGNATLFRRMQVLSDTGTSINLPFYAGNSLRGIMRDLLADHLLISLGMIPRRDTPPVNLWFFHALYAGGALEENSAATKGITAELGKNGIASTEGIRRFRDMLPSLSLLGTALGNRIVCGRIKVGDLRPRCKEWSTGDVPVAGIFNWEFLTRREDHENHVEHHGMIATTETIKPGVVLDGGIDLDFHISDIEKSALGLGLELLIKTGRIGAGARRDFGGVDITGDNIPSSDLYINFLAENKDTIVGYLGEIGAINEVSESDGVNRSIF